MIGWAFSTSLVLAVTSIVVLDKYMQVDDPVGAISTHGTAGIWGLLAVTLSNPDASFAAQLIGILAMFFWVFIASFAVWLILKLTMGIRITEKQEYEGADLSECGMQAYPEFMTK